MFEIYQLKRAKAKLELETVNKQLREINIQKEKERLKNMPNWERNIEIEIMINKMRRAKGKKLEELIAFYKEVTKDID